MDALGEGRWDASESDAIAVGIETRELRNLSPLGYSSRGSRNTTHPSPIVVNFCGQCRLTPGIARTLVAVMRGTSPRHGRFPEAAIGTARQQGLPFMSALTEQGQRHRPRLAVIFASMAALSIVATISLLVAAVVVH